MGWSRDAAGARAAAISAVSLTGDIAQAGFVTRADMIEALATTRYAPILAADSATQLAAINGDLADARLTVQAVRLEELPLTGHVVRADETTGRVDVWTVSVIAVNELAAPRQVWRTVTVDLLWERGDWRVDGWSARQGPTPALAVDAPVASADELLEVTSWSRPGAR
jgi:hypothetical protein